MIEQLRQELKDKEEELEEKEDEVKNKAEDSNKLLKKINECEE